MAPYLFEHQIHQDLDLGCHVSRCENSPLDQKGRPLFKCPYPRFESSFGLDYLQGSNFRHFDSLKGSFPFPKTFFCRDHIFRGAIGHK